MYEYVGPYVFCKCGGGNNKEGARLFISPRKNYRVVDQVMLTSTSPQEGRLLRRVKLRFRVYPTGKRRIVATNSISKTILRLSDRGTRRITTKVLSCGRVRPRLIAPRSVLIVKTSAIITYSKGVLKGPQSRTSTTRVLSVLSKRARDMCAKMALIFVSGGNEAKRASFCRGASIYVCPLSSTRVQHCVTNKRPVSGTKDCKVRKRTTTFIGRVRNSCGGIIKLPIKQLCRRLGGLKIVR